MFDFSGKRVLVAGGTGLVGIPIVELLLEEGALVRVVSLDDPSRAHPEAEFMRLDLLDFSNCLLACEGMEFAFNLLCMKGSPSAVKKYPATFFERNLELDILLLSAAQKAGVGGYLLASSVGAYPPGKEINQEDDAGKELPIADRGGAAKVAAEYHARCYREQYGMKVSIVRPANIYGPWDDFWSEGATVVADLVRQAAEGVNPLRIFRDGSQVRDFIYSRDVARGMLLIAKLGAEEPVNLGSGVGITMRELMETILVNVEKKPEVVWDTSRPTGDRRRVLDIARARALGFRPQVSLAAGIQKTTEWYRKHRHEASGRYSPFSS